MSDHSHAHPVTPIPVYIGVFLVLMIGTAITVAAAYMDLGPLNTPVALAIAGVKALTVVWFFMEVRHARPLTKLSAMTGVAFLAIMLILFFQDYLSRDLGDRPEGWRKDHQHSIGTVPEAAPPPGGAAAPAHH